MVCVTSCRTVCEFINPLRHLQQKQDKQTEQLVYILAHLMFGECYLTGMLSSCNM